MKINYQQIFEELPHNYFILDIDAPKFSILDVSSAHLVGLHTTREQLLGNAVLEMFPDNPQQEEKNSETLKQSLLKVLETKKNDIMKVMRYDIPKDDTFETRYWMVENKPVCDSKGNVLMIINSALDVTSVLETQFKELEQQENKTT